MFGFPCHVRACAVSTDIMGATWAISIAANLPCTVFFLPEPNQLSRFNVQFFMDEIDQIVCMLPKLIDRIMMGAVNRHNMDVVF